jgi:MFS family permease
MNESTFFLGSTGGQWIVVVYVAASVVVGALCSYVADVKGRSGWSWFFLGVLCGIFALIAIAGTPVLTVAPYKPVKRQDIEQDIEQRLRFERDDPENWTGGGGTQ